MIYVDSSVALAHLLSEQRRPPAALWKEAIVSSRLFEYEVMTSINSLGLADAEVAPARIIIEGIELLDLTVGILARALQPFPVPVRTLDALHLATVDYLQTQGQAVELATYDRRLAAAARALGFRLVQL